MLASFPCYNASTTVEKLICSDMYVSTLDDKLYGIYTANLQSAKFQDDVDEDAIRRKQRTWLKKRNNCEDITCLKNEYEARIKQLLFDDFRPEKIVRRDAEACQTYVDYANRNELSKLNASASGVELPSEKLSAIFGRNSNSYVPSGSYWQIDLNDDSVRDHLVISVEGTMRVGTGYALSGKNGVLTQSLYGDFDLDLLNIEGRFYIEAKNRLWRLSKNGMFLSVCKFKTLGDSVSVLVSGKDNPVCSKIDPDNIYKWYVDYSSEHKISALPQEERFWSKTPVEGLAQADINNDGQVENIVRLDFIHGGGRGCGATYVAVTDKSLSNIPDTDLNKLLLDELGGYPCGPNLNVLVHDGVAYVDAFNGNRTIYRIKGSSAKKVCEFQERGHYLAVDNSIELEKHDE